jgi:hypothetical protein
MAKRLLVIDSDGRGHFYLSFDGGTVSLGDSPGHAAAVLRDLHVSRIRCEVEVSDDIVAVSRAGGAAGPAGRHELHPGQGLRLGHAQLQFRPAPGDGPPQAAPPPAAAAPAAAHAYKRLHVIDGADQGHSYRLPESGTLSLGKSRQHADIPLHDLYVSRVHCLVTVEGDRVFVSHNEGENGTLVNGKRISEPHDLKVGDVVRLGNSHLRLETIVDDQEDEEPVEATAEEEEAEAEVEVVSEETAADRLLQLEGQVLGHYRVGSLLGRGHAGVVFRAQDLKNNLVVALKVLSPDFPASGAELQRFVQPLKILPQLHHANLVSLYNAGRTGSYCWIAREHVEGESIARLTKRLKAENKLNWGRAARVGVHLARVLAFLQQQKMVHGNVTPNNVLVRSADKVTKLADLMVMQALEGSVLQEAILEGKLRAELPYLAPEQTDPDAYVDQLADLYAVGAVVYLLLTGRPPFTGDSLEEILDRVREGKVVRPASYQRDTPGDFEAVILKLLSKHQEDRYQTAAELLADLEPIVREHEIAV